MLLVPGPVPHHLIYFESGIFPWYPVLEVRAQSVGLLGGVEPLRSGDLSKLLRLLKVSVEEDCPPKCFLSLLLCTPMCSCLATLSFHRSKSISLSSMDRNVHNSDYEKLFLFISYFILGTFVIVTESSLIHHLKHFINTLWTLPKIP